jgi:hypothetical protein
MLSEAKHDGFHFRMTLTRLIRHPLFVLCALALATYGLILLNDGLYYSDSWSLYVQLVERKFDILSQFRLSYGQPFNVVLNRFLALFASPISAAMILAFVCQIAYAWCVYRVARYFVAEREALLIAALTLIYPAYQFSIDIEHLYHLVGRALFGVGAVAIFANEAVPRLRTRVIAWLAFLLSYAVGSLLFFHYAVVLLLWLFASRGKSVFDVGRLARWCVRRADLLALPALYWLVTRTLWPTPGYNQPELRYLLDLQYWRTFIENGIYQPFTWALDLLPFIVPFALLALLIQPQFSRAASAIHPTSDHRAQLLIGLVLLFLAVFPYMAVGKPPQPHGYTTRSSLLLGAPMALIVVACWRIIFAESSGAISRLGRFVMLMLVLGFVAVNVDNNLYWLSRWAKDRAIMTQLADQPRARAASIIEVTDKFELQDRESAVTRTRFYYEWNWMFHLAFGDDKNRLGLENRTLESVLDEINGELPTHPFYAAGTNMDRFDANGCRVALTINAGAGAYERGKIGLTLRYLYYRTFAPAELQSFLRGLVNLQVAPIKNCG